MHYNTNENASLLHVEKKNASGKEDHSQDLGLDEALVHILKGNIGPGMLSLPYAFSKTGLYVSPPLLLFLASVAIYNINLLLLSKRTLQRRKAKKIDTFGEIGCHALGRTGQLVIDFFLTLTQFNICCVYFSYISANIHAVLPDNWKVALSVQHLILMIYPILLLLALIPTLHRITPYSAIATFAVLSGTGIALGYTFEHMSVATPVEPRPVTIQGVAEFFGAAVYSLEGIGLVLPIENALQENAKDSYRSVLLGAMSLIIGLYLALGELPLLSFGEITGGSITAIIEQYYSGWPINLANILLAFAVTFTFPLQFYPAIQVIEQRCVTIRSRRHQIVVRTLICTGLMGVAYLIPNVGLLISFFGSIGSSVLALIVPPLIYLGVQPRNSTCSLIIHSLIAIFGVVGLLTGSTMAMKDIITELEK